MGILRRPTKLEEIYQITSRPGPTRFLMALLFWIWGIGGFILVGIDLAEVMGKLKEGVGVGSSSFLAALAVVWIGGMVFFGLAALIAGANYSIVQRLEDTYGDVRVTR